MLNLILPLLPSSWDFFAVGCAVSPHSGSSTGPCSHQLRSMGLQTWGPKRVGDDWATELPLLRAALSGFTSVLFHTCFVSPICTLLHFRQILSLFYKNGSLYTKFLVSYSVSGVMQNLPFQTTPHKREWVGVKARWPCRGKLIYSFSLMSLAADVGLFETILISKFGFKVSTTHSAFAGDWAHCFIYTSRNQLILFWLHFPQNAWVLVFGLPLVSWQSPRPLFLGFCTMLDIGRPLL